MLLICVRCHPPAGDSTLIDLIELVLVRNLPCSNREAEDRLPRCSDSHQNATDRIGTMVLSYADAMKKERPPPVENSTNPSSSPKQFSTSQGNSLESQPPPSPRSQQKSNAAGVAQSGREASVQRPLVAPQPRNPGNPWGRPEPATKTGSERGNGRDDKIVKEMVPTRGPVQILSREKSHNESPSPWKAAASRSALPVSKTNARQQIKPENRTTEKPSAINKVTPKGTQPTQQQYKKKKPKPQLKSISIGDMITARPSRPMPPKGQEKQPKKLPHKQLLATDSAKDFPALGAPSMTNTPKLGFAKASWGKAAAPSKMPPSTLQHKKKSEKQTTKKDTGKSESAPNFVSPRSAAVFFQPKKEAPREGDEHQLLRLLQDRNVYQKKGRQRLHPRKKKFTALKKKVLQERLLKWYELHPEEKNEDGSTVAAAAGHSCSLCIYNYVNPDELEDDDEYEEILENLKDLASKVGSVKDVFVPRIDRTVNYPAFVLFDYAKDAAAAQACWEGLVLGGETLRVIMVGRVTDTGSDWKESVLVSEASIVSGDSDVAEASVEAVAVMELLGILTEDDYADEECMDESLEDLRSVAAKFGKLERLEAKEEKDGNVLLHYKADRKEAEAIFDGLRNTTIGGKPLSVSMVFMRATSPGTDRSMIVLENVLTDDDLEDEDCLNESLGDIRRLAGRHGAILDVQVVGKTVKIIYEGPPSVAERSAKELNGLTLAGVPVVASVENFNDMGSIEHGDSLYLYNILTDDDLDDEDCLQESLDDIRTLASKHGTIRELEVSWEDGTSLVRISYLNGAAGAVESALGEFDGMVVGGLIVTATSRRKLNSEEKSAATEESALGDVGKRKPDGQNETPSKKARTDEAKPLYSGDKLIPERFAQAKRVPKIPNPAGPREYANQTSDDRVRPLLAEMLGELMRLQKRAVEDNNTKAKRRLVLGLREVARGIRSHKVKMVVMANNLDEYGAIDEKLQEIIDLAHNEGVPLFFEFTKRSLGKAVGKSIKVAVVGVQNAEGAHQPFKKLNSLASKI